MGTSKLPCSLCTALLVMALVSSASPGALARSPAECRPGDRPETGLQGQIPRSEQQAGFEGFWCGLEIVGQNSIRNRGGNHQLAQWRDCAYYGTTSALGADPDNKLSAMAVIDAADPEDPRLVELVKTPGTRDITESLHAHNGIVAASSGTTLDVFDVSQDCRDPRQVSTLQLPFANHGARLTDDGKTWYGLNIAANPASDPDIEVVDLSKPARPKLMLTWSARSLPPAEFAFSTSKLAFHDMDANAEGTRIYLAVDALGTHVANGLMILDTSDIAKRRPDPEIRLVSYLLWGESADGGAGIGGGSHTAFLAHFDGKPYILAADEGIGSFPPGATACAQRSLTRTIDISDETNPQIVSAFELEVNQVANCPTVAQDNVGYGSHYVGVDNKADARLVFWTWFGAGLRVVDYADPANPKEIAYYNPPVKRDAAMGCGSIFFDCTMNDTTTPYAFYRRGNIWFGSTQNGFHIARLTNPLPRAE